MRAVNLIPADERRRGGSGRLSGLSPVTAGLLGVLLAGLVVVVALVMLGNAVTDRKAELDRVKAQTAATQRQADALEPYARVAAMRASSVAVVSGLADSRYDWPRLLDQVSRRVPADVKLTTMKGDVSALATPPQPTDGSSAVAAAAAPADPAEIHLTGCTVTLGSLARLMDRVRQIDGVGDVTLGTSTTADAKSGSGSDSSGPVSQGNCPHRRAFDLTLTLTAKDATS